MKTLLTLIGILFVFQYSSGQAPQAIQYQAIVRDNNGVAIVDQLVSFRLTIRDAVSGGPIIYRETQTVMTNSLGSISINIGQGVVVSGSFAAIPWPANAKFLQVEMDPAGGTSYIDLGTQQLMSVPYALHSASSAGNAGGDLSGTYPNPSVVKINGSPLGTTTGASNGNVLKWNGFAWASGSDNNSGGTVTSVTAGSGLTGGTITSSGTISLPNTGTAGTYGSSSLIPVITTDAQGRVSNVTTAAVSGSGWNLAGNNNTTDGTHFIGTTNGVALNFKVNNQNAGRIDYTNRVNTFFGYQSGNAITTGNENAAFGYQALTSATTGNENTAFGYNTLFSNVGAWGNTAFGFQSQYFANNSASQSFPYNTSIGHNSLRGSSIASSNTGTINTAIGAYTLYVNSSGSNNTAVGHSSMSDNSTGSVNTAIGFNTLESNVTGSDNTAIGGNAMRDNINTSLNVALGYQSQMFGYSGPALNGYNTSVGALSLKGSATSANNSGVQNTALGAQAMEGNSSGSYNTASGMHALGGNTTGDNNCAYGYQSLYNNDIGESNSAFGWGSMTGNDNGVRNSAFGHSALYYNNGNDNVACGYSTLLQTLASNGNTAIGYQAGATVNNGSNNTFLGNTAKASVAGLTNSMALGYNVLVSASNQVRIGMGVTSIGGPQDWSNTSDGRIKLNMREDVPGLSFIMKLRPVTYNKSLEMENMISGNKNKAELSSENEYEKIRYTGFVAQEVEKSANEIGYDFSGIDTPANANDLYSLRYATFVVPLVKAIQEQQEIITSQQKSIDNLQLENQALRTDIEEIRHQLGLEAKK